jgi:virginiamycin B lyase
VLFVVIRWWAVGRDDGGVPRAAASSSWSEEDSDGPPVGRRRAGVRGSDGSSANIGWLVASADHEWVWFADRGTGRIGRINAAGAVTEFQIPDGSARTALPQGIVLGPGRTVRFTDQANNGIGRLSLRDGSFTFADVPTPGSGPLGLTRGVDGDLYFVERGVAKIGRLDPRTGLFTEWILAPGAFPQRIVTASNAGVYFTELSVN